MLYVSNDKATSKSNLSLVNPDHSLSALNACPLSQNFLSGKIALYKCQKNKSALALFQRSSSLAKCSDFEGANILRQ